jgi:putative N6-adenine-specific DNA methylase
MRGTAARLSAFAVAAPGLEPWLTRELGTLGIDAREEAGGASFAATLEEIYRANLWSRLASRIIVRIADFRVRALGELSRRASTISWDEWLAPGARVRVRASARKSRLYHTGAIAERVLEGIDKRVRVKAASARTDPPPAGEEDDDGAEPLLIVRIARDVCTISLDSSGALLHRRGYRQAVAKAPLRETLAAAMLATAGWRPTEPLADPFCGAGTIPIEAAMISRDMAPGINRGFAFEHWPRHDAARWRAVRAVAHERVRAGASAPIFASDRDEGAVAAARDNAQRAGVEEDVQIVQAPLSAAPLGTVTTWIVTNPPYGVRVGEAGPLRDLYAALGRVVREGGHPLVMLSADSALDRQLRLPLETVLSTKNGGIDVAVRRSVARTEAVSSPTLPSAARP